MGIDVQVKSKSARTMKSFRETPIDGTALKHLVEASLIWLRTNQQLVNSLNVFPVPDGDTGTNMVLTMQAAFDEISRSPENNFGKMAHAVANGALMGARGNSGVILSQLWRGFARSLDSLDTLDAASMVHAFGLARDTAYRGVVRPVEGTILTVAKDAALESEKALGETQDPVTILERVVMAADQSVQNTPNLLPVLKEAGVVDAGGTGLFFILEGMLRYISGQPLEVAVAPVQPLEAMKYDNTLELIEPGQDFEVVVDFRPDGSLDLPGFYHNLEEIGTSIQVGEGDGIYRMHIHVPTEKRYEPIDYVMSLGTITKVAMENLVAQMNANPVTSPGNALILPPVEPDQIAVVAVSPGEGITRVFASLGVAAIVPGGQTMNPSTQEILAAFENLPTDKIIILPNNKNIILTAESAAELTVKKVAVIPTKSVPQGLAAMMRLVPDGDMDQVVGEMTSALEDVVTGEITTSTRSVAIDGVDTKEGQIIVLHNGRLILSSTDLQEALLGFLDKAHANEYELITLFYGADLSRQDANQLAELVRQSYPHQEVELQEGGQPHYYFIISLE
jgi:DAK2 domain fusion protein YloV